MTLRLFILFITLFLSTSLFSQKWEWVRAISGTANDTGYSIDVDDSGYVFMTGRCKQLTTFENDNNPFGPITIGDRDVYISKYSSEGELVWATLAGTEKAPNYDQGYSIVADNSGGCYVAGIFNDTSFFGPDTLFSDGMRDAFITKLDINGNFLWSRRVGSDNHDYARHVAIDNNGDILFCGNTHGMTIINGDVVGTVNQPTAYIIKYDPNGNLLNYAHFDTPYKSSFEQFTFDTDNNTYVVGSINGHGVINGTTIASMNSPSWQDVCIIKLDEQLNVIWSETAGGNYYDIAHCITFKDSSIYIGGSYSSTAVFDTITTTFNSTATGSASNQHKDLYIAAYNLNGNIRWLKTGGNEGVDEIYGLKISENNNIYASGFYRDSLTLDNSNIYAQPNVTNGIIFKMDTAGQVDWYKNLSHTFDTRCYQLDIDKYENIFVTGDFYGTINFDTIIHTGQNRDAFGGKLLQPTSPSYFFNNSQDYCLGDTTIIELTSLTSPISYEYIPNDSYTSWIDSNLIYYIVEFEPSMNLAGNIITSNYYYSDTIQLDITLNSFNNPTPFLISDTTICDTISDFTLYSEDFYYNYFWSNNISNNNFSNPVNTSENINLTVIDSNNCSGSNQVSVMFQPCLTISEKTSQCKLTYYEKSNTLKNNCPLNIIDLKIVNMNGQTIHTIDDMKDHGQISMPDLSPGVYLITAKYSNLSVQTQKILILN